MPYKVGLTGGIGSGKSTVAQAFAELGVPTLSADAIGHELSRKNRPGYLKIIEDFGTSILKPDGELDRKALGDFIFSDRDRKAQLESILHPMIMQTVHQQADALDTPYCILEIPLLINTAERERVNRILVVHCAQKERIVRIQKRSGWPLEKIDQVMRNQVSDQALLAAADDVLDNDGDIAAIGEQVADLHSRYLLLAKK